MSLLAVRHGQASFGGPDYDLLSPAGWQQGERLGRWLAAHGPAFGRVVSGSMRRHLETVEAIGRGFGGGLPAVEIDPDLDEFDHRAVVAAFLQDQPELRPLLDGSARPSPQAVMFLLRGALGRWAAGDYDQRLDEGWHAFGERVRRGGRRLLATLDHGDTLLVSSGGTLSRLAQQALEAPEARAVELNLSLRNCGLCEFHAVDGVLRLTTWNALPHLADARELWTHY